MGSVNTNELKLLKLLFSFIITIITFVLDLRALTTG